MKLTASGTKLIAIFVVVFICLNAGGFVCVAYCQSSLKSFADSQDHCPLQKSSEHCDPAEKADLPDGADSIGTNKIECCRMAFSFIAAPLEKRTFSAQVATLPVIVQLDPVKPTVFADSRQTPLPTYRGPPLDRRVERLKHCLIRI